MKTNSIKRIACLAVLGAALAWANGTARADTLTNMLFTFDMSEGFLSWWGGQYAGYWDTPDANGNFFSGSLYYYEDLSQCYGVYAQCDFTGSAGWPYIWTPTNSQVPYYVDLSTATNLSFDVLWDITHSTLGIDDFNDQDYATSPGWGDHGLDLQILVTTNANWDYVANVLIPEAASNGWVHVNVPIPVGLANMDQAVGIVLQKYSNTPNTQTGVFAFWLDNIAAEGPAAPVPPPTLKHLASPSAQGLNIYDTGNAGDRQSVATIVTNQPDYNYAWVGNPTPVTYSVTIAQSPAAGYTNYQAHIMIVPGNNVTETAPDWNEANALVLFIERQINSSVVGFLRYKLNQPGNNTWLFGTDTNVFGGGGSAVTNTIVAGYGGRLGTVTNASGYVGTWSITISQDTNIMLHSPDGSTSTMAFPQLSDARGFAYPVSVFWGTQPNTAGWQQDVVFSSVSIIGSTNSLNVDLTRPLDSTKMAVRAMNSSLMFATPTNAVYWLQWTLPDVGFGLQSASSLTGTWSSLNPTLYTIGGKHSGYITRDLLPSSGAGFFRLAK
jgi:hypothetical protein